MLKGGNSVRYTYFQKRNSVRRNCFQQGFTAATQCSARGGSSAQCLRQCNLVCMASMEACKMVCWDHRWRWEHVGWGWSWDNRGSDLGTPILMRWRFLLKIGCGNQLNLLVVRSWRMRSMIRFPNGWRLGWFDCGLVWGLFRLGLKGWIWV